MHVARIMSHIDSLDGKIQRQNKIAERKNLLKSLKASMECMDTLVHVDRKLSETSESRLRLPLLYRASDLICRIYGEEKHICATSWYASIRERLTIADVSFAKILGEELLASVHSCDVQKIQDYCTIYKHVGRMHIAHQVVAEGAVKPAVLPVRTFQFPLTRDWTRNAFLVSCAHIWRIRYEKQGTFFTAAVCRLLRS